MRLSPLAALRRDREQAVFIFSQARAKFGSVIHWFRVHLFTHIPYIQNSALLKDPASC
jgi:hypothetical protein